MVSLKRNSLELALYIASNLGSVLSENNELCWINCSFCPSRWEEIFFESSIRLLKSISYRHLVNQQLP